MKKILILVGLLICTFIFMWLGVNSINAAFMEYAGIAAIASGLSSIVYFIFGYKGCSLVVKYLTRWINE